MFCLAGVVLIARPAVIFGNFAQTSSDDDAKVVTPEQRMMAVGYARIFINIELENDVFSESLLSEFLALLAPVRSNFIHLKVACSLYIADVSIRAIGKRASPMHTLSYFSVLCVTVSGVG